MQEVSKGDGDAAALYRGCGSWDQHVDQAWPGMRKLCGEPSIFLIEGFLNDEECDEMIRLGSERLVRAPVVAPNRTTSKVGVKRTSSTSFISKELAPWFLDKVSQLTQKPVGHMERPQVGRYLEGEWYASHYDAVDMASEVGAAFRANGGQRLITVLCYLNTPEQGGSTTFNSAGVDLEVQPKRGNCVMFFPATLDGELDQRLLHTAQPAVSEKWVSQVWIRQSDYEYE